jgi:hypothetical protein
MAFLAQRVRRRFAEALGEGEDWLGEERFRGLLERLDLSGLAMSRVIPGYLYDPERHDPPQERRTNEEFRARHPDLADLAIEIHRITETPLLLPEQYRLVFEELAREVTANGFHLFHTAKNVRDRLNAMGVPVGRGQLNFICIGIGRAGKRLGEGQPEDPLVLAKAFAVNVHTLATAAQIPFDRERYGRLFRWIIPARLASGRANGREELGAAEPQTLTAAESEADAE